MSIKSYTTIVHFSDGTDCKYGGGGSWSLDDLVNRFLVPAKRDNYEYISVVGNLDSGEVIRITVEQGGTE